MRLRDWPWCELPFGLIEHRLKRPRIDLKQQLSFLDERAFGVVLREQIAGHLRLDLGVDHPVERADPFAVDRNILLLHVYDLHLGWGWRLRLSRRRGAAASNQQKRQTREMPAVTICVRVDISFALHRFARSEG